MQGTFSLNENLEQSSINLVSLLLFYFYPAVIFVRRMEICWLESDTCGVVAAEKAPHLTLIANLTLIVRMRGLPPNSNPGFFIKSLKLLSMIWALHSMAALNSTLSASTHYTEKAGRALTSMIKCHIYSRHAYSHSFGG